MKLLRKLQPLSWREDSLCKIIRPGERRISQLTLLPGVKNGLKRFSQLRNMEERLHENK